MLSLHTNSAALFTQSNMGLNQRDLTTAMTRLGTGYRINSAMDDAAGLQIATRLDTQTRGMKVAMRNTQDGISYLQTAEGALGEVSNVLLRMKDLATAAANGTASDDDKKAMQSEYDELGKQVANIFKNTAFGGEKLLTKDGKLATGGLTLQIGDTKDQTMVVDGLKGEAGKAGTPATPATGFLGLDSSLQDLSGTYKTAITDTTGKPKFTAGTELTTAGGANGAIEKLAGAINNVSQIRSGIGAVANRLQSTYNNLSNMSNNTSIAKGRIMDTDYASETATMTSHQMLMQAGTAMLKQSGSMNQMVMSLIQ